MTVKHGVSGYPPRIVNTFSTADKKIDLQITHEFFDRTTVSNSPGSYIASRITLKNTGTIPLKDVTIYIDVDDDSALFDAHITDSSGNIIDSSGTPSISFGDLIPGATSSEHAYWWTVREVFPEAQGSQTNSVFLRLYPMFVADFKQSNQAFTSTSRLENS